MYSCYERPTNERPRLGGGCWCSVGLIIAMIACPGSAYGQNRLKVVGTTTMITDLARQIAGDDADVSGIMRPGEDPHIYEVRPRDVQLIAGADLLLANGLHLESTLGHVITNNTEGATVVLLAETPRITPLQSEKLHGAPDPHCWFNVTYFRVFAERTRDALVKIDPNHADGYRQRATSYLAELDELHNWVRQEISRVPREQRVMVTSHDAFQYFGEAYDIDVFAVIGISTEQQPKPRDLTRLASIVRERHVKALFIETSVSQTLNTIVTKIAKTTGAKIGGTLYSDSLGPPDSPAGTYIGMVRENVKTVVRALQ